MGIPYHTGRLEYIFGMPNRIERCYDPILEDQVVKSTPRNRQNDAIEKK